MYLLEIYVYHEEMCQTYNDRLKKNITDGASAV